MVWDPMGVLGSLDDAVAVCEPDGTLLFGNAAAARLLGAPAGPFSTHLVKPVDATSLLVAVDG